MTRTQNENLIMQRGYDEFFVLYQIWTFPYGPKVQWSKSQKANFQRFKQGQF